MSDNQAAVWQRQVQSPTSGYIPRTPVKKQGTRVFKKSSPNGKITTYLCKRDFIDSLTHCDPIEGVVLIDADYVRDRKVFVHVLSAFRYGREDLDVLGLTFRKDLYLASAQVYPCVHADDTGEPGSSKQLMNPSVIVASGMTHELKGSRSLANEPEGSLTDTQPLTRLQERLLKKIGGHAYPFFFQLPPDAPASVILQPGPNENGKPCGVDYELRTYVADTTDEKSQKRNSVRLAIRKLTYAAEEPAPQPSAVMVKEFLMSPGSLRLEVSLDKEKYYHGESITVNVLVDNNSNKTVKKMKLSVRQITELCLHNHNRYVSSVDELETEEAFPIQSCQTGWCKVYQVQPMLQNNRHKRGLALDGKLKHEDTNLASSTITSSSQHKENLGMTVQYRVKVRLVLGFGLSDVTLELPFTLTHPKPVTENDEQALKIHDFEDFFGLTASIDDAPDSNNLPDLIAFSTDDGPVNNNNNNNNNNNSPAEPINTSSQQGISTSSTASTALRQPQLLVPAPQLTATSTSRANDTDDLIFEDFARLRLKAYSTEQPPSN